MVVRNSEVYHTILQNQDHCLKIELKSVFNLRLQAIVLYKLALIRLIGLIKASLYRTIGKAQLTWAELEEVLLDIEIILNNRPLSYIEEEIEYTILTPNSLILLRDVNFPDAAPHESESETIKKRHKHIKQCKEAS